MQLNNEEHRMKMKKIVLMMLALVLSAMLGAQDKYSLDDAWKDAQIKELKSNLKRHSSVHFGLGMRV